MKRVIVVSVVVAGLALAGSAAAALAPWTFVGTGNWAGWGSGMEGPNVVRLDDGSWKIFLDGQGAWRGGREYPQPTATPCPKWSAHR